MSKTREEQQLVLEGTAYDNFINAVRSKSSQNSNNQDRKIRIDLKIFRETERPEISNNHPVYFKKHRYNMI
jgi:hypothetical protein